MTQTKTGSLTEAVVNIAIGYSVAIMSQVVLFPLFGIHVPLSTKLYMSIWFTVISLVRSYAVRRLFNRWS